MPFKVPELAKNANGGSEMMTRRLEQGLKDAGRQDLLDYFNFHPSRVEDRDEDAPSILICHDLANDPSGEHLFNDCGRTWDLIAFVSDWQHQQFMSHYRMNGHNATVIPNAIVPFGQNAFDKWDVTDLGSEANPVKLIYHTTPHRGLEILVPVFEFLYDQFKALGKFIELDVYSSFNLYGWGERDEPYTAIFEKCKAHSAIRYHGAVSNDEVRTALESAHIFAFPSIWQESFCLSIVEAMSAGVIPVHSNLANLPNVSGGFTISYPFINDTNQHASRFHASLYTTISTLVSDKSQLEMLPLLAAQRVNLLYSIDNVIPQWISTLSDIMVAKQSLTPST
jgi:UDP-glucose:(glucosyl)LPS alpha-1,2-glucosyltransferase